MNIDNLIESVIATDRDYSNHHRADRIGQNVTRIFTS